ncbi:DUF5808 domain-containing protein [Kitasatospora cystarginea]|uniref:DUF5808 domain-containing protein n=1 Tax=Kitasatospora cystarginea TaxID=58350 RepID=A0ABN3E934_9ACTN
MTTGTVVVQEVIPSVLLLTAWLMPSLTGPTLPFGVRTPPARAHAPVIAEQRRAYRWLVGGVGGVLVAAGLALAFADPRTPLAGFTSIGVLVVSGIGYLRARRAILAVKQREDWYAGLRQAVVADTSLRTRPERFPWLWAVPSLVVLAVTAVAAVVRYPSMPDQLPMHYGDSGTVDRYAAKSVGSAFSPVFVQLAVTTLLLVVIWYAFRSRAELDPARPAASASQHRRYIVRMSAALLVLTACVDVTVLCAGWQIWDGDRSLAVLPVLAPAGAGMVAVVAVAIRTGRNGSRLPVPEGEDGTEPARTDAVHRDDDRYWRFGGVVYVNRQDPAIFVGKRFGIGWSLNFGNPRALLPIGVFLGFLLVMQLIGH